MTSEPTSTKNLSPVLWANVPWPIMGSHSGMGPLFGQVQALAPGFVRPMAQKSMGLNFINIWESRLRRVLHPARWKNIQRENAIYLETSWALEEQIHDQVMRTSPAVVVLDSIEDQFYLLAEKRASWSKTRLVGMCHTPPAWWRLRSVKFRDRLRSLDALVNLSMSARPYWVSLLGEEKVLTIPHGVDVDFFRPDEAEPKLSASDGKLRAACVGRSLRDFETMANIVAMVDQLDLPICFEMVVPLEVRGTDACYRIAMSPRVRWHAGVSDEGLRRIYQQSDLGLIILTDATANNALMEGMACGLPIIITDVGGVREYALESFTDFVRPRDATQAVEVLRSYIGQTNKLKERGLIAREHVESNFPWKKVAAEYLAFLQKLAASV